MPLAGSLVVRARSKKGHVRNIRCGPFAITCTLSTAVIIRASDRTEYGRRARHLVLPSELRPLVSI